MGACARPQARSGRSAEDRNQAQERAARRNVVAGQGRQEERRRGLARDPEKWAPVFGKDHAQRLGLPRERSAGRKGPRQDQSDLAGAFSTSTALTRKP